MGCWREGRKHLQADDAVRAQRRPARLVQHGLRLRRRAREAVEQPAVAREVGRAGLLFRHGGMRAWTREQ